MKQESEPSPAASVNPVGAEAIAHFTAAAVNARRALVAHAAAVLAMQRRGGSLRAIAKAFSATLGREISKKQVETVLHSIKSGRIVINEAEVAAMEARILGQLAAHDAIAPTAEIPQKPSHATKPAKPAPAKKEPPRRTSTKSKPQAKPASPSKNKAKIAPPQTSKEAKGRPKLKQKPKATEKKTVEKKLKRPSKPRIQQSTFFFGE